MITNHRAIQKYTRDHLLNSNIKIAKNMVQFIDHIAGNNPHDKKEERLKFLMWQEQCCINLPILYFASIFLYKHAMNLGKKVFLFTTRDCCHWYKMFKKMFPRCDCYYFNCSRMMFKKATRTNNPYFKQYIQKVIGRHSIDDVIYIDLHGTGRRMYKYFERAFGSAPYCFILSARPKNYQDFDYSITQRYIAQQKFFTMVFDISGKGIEMLNYDSIGTLIEYNRNGPVRDTLEYDYNLIEPYHDSIDYIINQIYPIKPHKLNSIDQDDLLDLVNELFNFLRDNDPTITIYFSHIKVHKNNNLNIKLKKMK